MTAGAWLFVGVGVFGAVVGWRLWVLGRDIRAWERER
jgi:hypothetical protein